MFGSLRTLFWKNWRVKQRDSRLNRNRNSKQCLFPPLIFEVLAPSLLFLVIIQQLCKINASFPSELAESLNDAKSHQYNSQNIVHSKSHVMEIQRQMSPMTTENTQYHVSAALLWTVLPLVLSVANHSIIAIDRPNARSFISHLEQKYPLAKELGILPISKYIHWVQLPTGNGTNTDKEADDILSKYMSLRNSSTYAGLDLRSNDQSLELLVYFQDFSSNSIPNGVTANQFQMYLSRSLKSLNKSDERSFSVPDILPFEAELRLFLENEKVHESQITNLPPPSQMCEALSTLLWMGDLSWSDFPSAEHGNPLGKSSKSCISTLTYNSSAVSTSLMQFLTVLVKFSESKDGLETLNVSNLPPRPQAFVSGPLETSIILYICFIFLAPYAQLVRDIVAEKESQMKEYLLVLGCSATPVIVSWVLLYLVGTMGSIILAVLFLQDTLYQSNLESNVSFIALLSAFSLSVCTFGAALSPIFQKAKTAAAIAPLCIMMLAAFPYMRSLVGEEAIQTSTTLSITFSILEYMSSPTTFIAALHEIAMLDSTSLSIRMITYSTIMPSALKLLTQSLIYSLLGAYLEAVYPRTWGVRQQWYFILQPTFWLSFCRSTSTGYSVVLQSEMETSDHTVREFPFEVSETDEQTAMTVLSLSKKYDSGTEAVKNVSFHVNKGEIFGLLGPNGAGKSTTMAVICAMLQPTSGDVWFNMGNRIKDCVSTHPEHCRKRLSVCFQQNLLFDNLTVLEHIELVINLKGNIGVRIISTIEVETYLKDFSLMEKKFELAKTLSGGQKRKLCLLLALLVDAAIVLLDEPTAGVDLPARRDIWQVLKSAATKNNRALVLTTHSMAEAQVLCNTIGIMADGELQCCGSSLFLQERYGIGYKLTIVHSESADVDTPNVLLETIQSLISEGKIITSNKWESRFSLENADNASISKMCQLLDDMKSTTSSRVDHYSLTATDLEDVFVAVTSGDLNKNSKVNDLDHQTNTRQSKGWIKHNFPFYFCLPSPLYGLIVKRCKLLFRDKRTFIGQYVWPLVLLFALLSIMFYNPSHNDTIENMMELPWFVRYGSTKLSQYCFVVSSPPELSSATAKIVQELQTSIVTSPVLTKYQSSSDSNTIIQDILANQTNVSFIGGVFINQVEPALQFTMLYNESIEHSLPIAMNWFAEAICQLENGDITVASKFCKLELKRDVITELQSTNALSDSSAQDVTVRVIISFYILVTIASVAMYYVSTVVKEDEIGLKRQQLRHIYMAPSSYLKTTRKLFLYWFSNFIVDFGGYIFIVLSIAGLIYSAASSHIVDNRLLVHWSSISILAGFAILPFLYLFSRMFTSHSSALSATAYLLNFQILFVGITFGLSLVPGRTCEISKNIQSIASILPVAQLGFQLLHYATEGYEGLLPDNCGDQMDISAGDYNIGWIVTIGLAILYWTALMFSDVLIMYPSLARYQWYRIRRKISSCICSWNHSYNVVSSTHEETAIVVGIHTSPILSVMNISKVYEGTCKPEDENSQAISSNENSTSSTERVKALNNVSFDIPVSDCVTLLGPNGSGKSSLFEILSGGRSPSEGNAFVSGWDITTQPQNAAASLAYCPQTNILVDELTVVEHLHLFYRLGSHGLISQDTEDTEINNMLRDLELLPVANKAAMHLSGGNKRRVMLAIALLRKNVVLLLLDEPSAGVDVAARQIMWKILKEKTSIDPNGDPWGCLFTTHSMEEAEAVCANAVVLKKGNVIWNDSITKLKQRSSRGIAMTIELDTHGIWEGSERLAEKYTSIITQMLIESFLHDETVTRISSNAMTSSWRLCVSQYHNLDIDTIVEIPEWLQNLITNFKDDPEGIGIDIFVKEWLVYETFSSLENELFGQIWDKTYPVTCTTKTIGFVDGNVSPNAIYETSCTNNFGLSMVFNTLETHKHRFHIARYTVSELSLERIFQQLE